MKNKNIFVFLIIIMIMLIGYDSNGQIIKDTINPKQSLIEKNKEVIKNKVIQARSHQLTDIKPWYKPNYINVQYAGNIGFYHLEQDISSLNLISFLLILFMDMHHRAKQQ